MAFENDGFEATADAGTSNVGFNQENDGSEGSSQATQSSNAQHEQQFSQMQSEIAKMRQANQDLLRDLTAHKEELARDRETKRRALLQMSGDQDFLQEEAQKKRAAQIADELKQLAKYNPELQQFLGNQNQGASLGDKVFYNTATQKAHELATTVGFESPQGKEFMSLMGNILISSVPDWERRFRREGNMEVLNEVFDYIKTSILDPRDKIIENKIIERIRKQGRSMMPVPRGSAGSTGPALRQNPVDVKNPTSLHEAFMSLGAKHLNDGYE